MPQPPTFRKVNPADSPILYIALTSPTLPLYTLDEYGETLMAQRISMVNGVAQVGVFGSQKYAVRVQLNPDALASRGIGIDAVENAIRTANVNLPLGTLDGTEQSFILQASGQLTTAEPYRSIIVAYRNGSPVRLGQLGRVLDSVEDDKTAAWYGNRDAYERSLVLTIQRQPGANLTEGGRSRCDAFPSPQGRAQQSVPRAAGIGAAISEGPDRALKALPQRDSEWFDQWRHGSAQHDRESGRGRRTTNHQPPRPVACRDDFL
jgi:AcrB/AcrD/AcrF family